MLTIQVTALTITAEWVSAMCNILLLILTAISVYYAFRAYRHQKNRSKKQAACDLAKYYANNIIDKYSDVANVFDSCGIISSIREIFDLRELQDFDRTELEELLRKGNMTVDEFEDKLKNIDPMAILNARMSGAGSAEERGKTYNSYTKVGDDGKVQVINGIFLKVDFDQEISGLLNELEWFAMNCKYGLADEKLIYQSLHQTFISTVWMLYFYISHRNVNNEDKLYTNLVWLFIQWRDRLVNITDSKEAEKQEYIDKANSVKAKVYEGTSLR